LDKAAAFRRSRWKSSQHPELLLPANQRCENIVSVLQIFASSDLAEGVAPIEDFKRNLGAARTGPPASDVPDRPRDQEHDCGDDSEDNDKRCIQNDLYQSAYHAEPRPRADARRRCRQIVPYRIG
jgi:hypothetical protein